MMDLYVVRKNNHILAGPFFSYFAAETAKFRGLVANLWNSYSAMWEDALIDTLRWTEREQLRFDELVYLPPCWNEIKEFTKSRLYRDHYVHVSMDDPTMLAFTPDDAYGEADRQVKMKPGRYLNKYFPSLGAKRIETLSHWFVTGQRPPLVDLEAGLKFTTNSDEAEWVYKNGPTSCMAGKDFDVHPARVYATDDVCVAYMLSASDKECVVARAVVNQSDKTYGRIYPTVDNWSEDGFSSYSESQSVREELDKALKEAGYRYRSSFLDGCKIKKIQLPDDPYTFAMPYIDGDYSASSEATWDYFLLEYLRGGENNTTPTRGYIECDDEHGTLNSNTARCECCEDTCDEDELVRVVTVVSNTGTYALNSERWCSHCVETNAYYCSGLNATVSDNVAYIIDSHGATYNLTYAEEHMFVSDFNDDWYHNDDDDIEYVLTEGGVQRWSNQQAIRNAFECPILEKDERTDAMWCHSEYASERYTTFGGAPAKLNGDLDDLSEDEFNALKERLELTDEDIKYIPPRCELTEELPLVVAA